MPITILVQGISYGFAAGAQPGPFQAYVISQTIRSGWRRTLPVAFAPLISDGPIILLMVLVLSYLPPFFERILRIGGGLYILYLAWSAFVALRRSSSRTAKVEPPARNVWRGALMNMLNPNPYIFWGLVTGPILLQAWRQSPLTGLGFLASFYGTMIGTIVVTIAAFGLTDRFGPRAVKVIAVASVVALTGFGIYQLVLGIGAFV